MKVFLDTNTLLDHIYGRTFLKEMNVILEGCYNQKLDAYLSVASLYTLNYYVQKKMTTKESKQLLLDYLTIIKLVDSTSNSIFEGLKSSFKDIEDSFQYLSAKSIPDLDYFITGNTKDFKQYSDSLPVLNPAEFLKEWV
jgi:predicted nucleic acid-binding protein